MTGHPLSLSVEELLARSRGIAGVDLVDENILEPLTILHRAYSEEAALDAEGAAGHTRNLLNLLVNRLLMKRDFAAHPEIREQPISGPLVIMGVARSGTTKLQKVLAASGDFNFLPFWMNYSWGSRSGVPNEPLDQRIAEADAFCRWYDERSPETKRGHAFETLEPEEESQICLGSFASPTFLGFAELPSYAAWLAEQPRSIEFAFLRECMQYLQWQGLASPDKPWLLKSPNYNGVEPVLFGTFPEARLIMAHRSPLQTLTSMCKLIECFREAYTPVKPDLAMLVEYNYFNMDTHLANRCAHPDLPLLDLRFEDIVGDLGGVLARVYAEAGLSLTEASLQRMLRWDEENAMHGHGEFKYSLAEFGLEEAVIRERMADYFALLQTLASEAA